jgi:hypothetical protein
MSASDHKTCSSGFISKFSKWSGQRPVLVICLVSLLAVIVSCYPVIFCGKSFVSPTSTRDQLVYNWWPSLPGMESQPALTQNVFHYSHGSDVAAIMWWGVPAGFIESRSLLDYGEFPLWNRYSHAGEPFLGQAVTMLGDPLQLIVIFGRGAAWAWDVKFLAAKFLFCFGFGLLILRLLGGYMLSLIFTALAAYCGAYFFIYSHPAFFVFAYAPWILLSAINWLKMEPTHPVRWSLVWLVANFACFNAGHVEVAVVLIGGLNLAALVLAMIGCRSATSCAGTLCRMGIGTLLFLGLTAPVWMPFLAALEGSYSAHMKAEVIQLPLANLPGAFDDFFYLLSRPNNLIAPAPGASLLILAGCIISASRWRQLKEEAFFWINSSAIVIWAGCIFGWIPSSLLVKIPLLNRVGHTYTDFSYLLIIHLTIQCAYGFKCLAKTENLRQVAVDFVCITSVFTAGFLTYFFACWHQPIPWGYFSCAAAGAIAAPLLFAIMMIRRQRISASRWVCIIILGFIPHFRFGFYNFGDEILMMIPGQRATLNAPSKSIDTIKSGKSEPFRVVGMPECLAGNYSAAYGLEDIRSCVPLGNDEFVNLVRAFPGFELLQVWKIKVIHVSQAQPLLNLLNVKYLLTWENVTIDENLDFRIAGRGDFAVVENPEVWPRAFFARKILRIDSNIEFIHQLSENGREPFIALTTGEIQKLPGLRELEATNQTAISSATNYVLAVNSTAFDVHAPTSGVVCLTEGQAKDFTATANGEPKEVLTVNRAFKGIYLDKPGDYHVQFTYRPRHWRLACALFWISICGCVIMSFVEIICARISAGKQN